MPRAGPFDWLGKDCMGERDRPGQTLAQFLRPGPHRSFPSRNQPRIYLVGIGDVASAPPAAELCAVLRAMLFTLEVVCLPKGLPKKEVAALARDSEGAGYGPQIETPAVHELLRAHRPRDAFAVVAYTMSDLCNTEKGFGYLFGEACCDKGVGVFSFARYSDDSPPATSFMRRCSMVLCHEVGHLFGIKHCVYSRCLMNGSNSLEEGEDRPFALCPVDQRKLEATLNASRLSPAPVDLVARERDMAAIFQQYGMEEDLRLARLRIAAMQGRAQAGEEKGA